MAASEDLRNTELSSFRCHTVKQCEKMQVNKKRNDLVKSLMNRELYGTFSRPTRASSIRPQSLKPLVPKSCFTFRLQDLIPKSALLKGHIVLGFSRCGQFLLTYTCGSYEALLGFNNRYVLHWWACIPRGKAKRVAEVTLFKDQGVDENLYLALCQWPNDNTKMLIYGVSEPHFTTTMTTQAQPFYLTVTMVPSLHNCQDCQRVAATYEVEDLAANWDSCVRLSCLRHSATIHTNCDIVSPFPNFEPEINMKSDGTVIINTGNFLHVLRIELESSERNNDSEDPLLRQENEDDDMLSSLLLQNCELSYSQNNTTRSTTGTAGGPHASPIMFLKSPQYFSTSEDEEPIEKRPRVFLPDSESDDSIISNDLVLTKNKIQQQTQKSKDNNSKEKLFFFNEEPITTTTTTPTQNSLKQLEEAEKAYEFIDENPPDIKLSVYRLRRLADKKYEFSVDAEDESENIIPYRVVRQESPNKKQHESSPQPCSTANQASRRILPSQSTMQELSIHTSPPFSPSDSEDSKVLRPLNSNSLVSQQQMPSPREGSRSSPRPCHMADLASPGGRSKREQSVPVEQTRKPFKYLVTLQRRYFEVDDEIVSVITDIEDDDLSATTGYHSALPLEVHGSGYAQMQMVSNSKAEKLRASCILVQQTSFDIEQFCHEMAQVMCADAGMKYWFCNDYDVEIVDVCPNSGDVIVVAFLLLQATGKTKGLTKTQRHVLSGLQRRMYQGSFVFTWNLDSGRYWVVRASALREPDQGTPWHPARHERNAMRRLAPPLPTHPPVRKLTNLSVLKGVSLSTLIDLENHTRLILQ